MENSNDSTQKKGFNHKRFWGMLIVALVIAVFGFFYDRGTTVQEAEILPAGGIDNPARQEITLTIKNPDNTLSVRTMERVPADTTAFDLFALGDIEIEYDDYSFGKLVTTINGIEQGGEGDKYWIWYVNGERAQIGADSYVVEPGDEIYWQYEENIYK